MGKIKNQKGFSVIEGLLILILIVIVGFAGWYVYNSNKKTNVTLSAATQESQSAFKNNQSSEWKTYSDPKYHLKFSYPVSWFISSTDDKSNSAYANKNGIILHRIDIKSTANVGGVGTSYWIYITNDTLNNMIQVGENDLLSNGGGIDFKTSNITINGNKATQLTAFATKNNKIFSTDVYTSGNGLVYDFESQTNFSDGKISSPIASHILHSITITK